MTRCNDKLNELKLLEIVWNGTKRLGLVTVFRKISLSEKDPNRSGYVCWIRRFCNNFFLPEKNPVRENSVVGEWEWFQQ
jgi:hypothetical protein